MKTECWIKIGNYYCWLDDKGYVIRAKIIKAKNFNPALHTMYPYRWNNRFRMYDKVYLKPSAIRKGLKEGRIEFF